MEDLQLKFIFELSFKFMTVTPNFHILDGWKHGHQKSPEGEGVLGKECTKRHKKPEG